MFRDVIIFGCLQVEKSLGLARDMVAHPILQHIRLSLHELDLGLALDQVEIALLHGGDEIPIFSPARKIKEGFFGIARSEEHTSELQSLRHLVCRLLLEK